MEEGAAIVNADEIILIPDTFLPTALLPYTEPVKAIILWILLIIFSYVAVVIIYRIPRFGKYILYMR